MYPKRIHLDTVGSTNRHLSEIIKSETPTQEIVLIADYQENGMGQGDHHWHSSKGENLLMSVLLFPAFLSASSQFHLSRVASLALCDTLKGLDLTPQIKWPNDILVEGKKIAGILIENGISGQNLVHSILGIGLNVNQRKFPEFPLPATSMVLEGQADSDIQKVAVRLLKAIGIRYSQLEGGLVASLEADYLAHMFNLDRPSRYTAHGRQFSGTIKGVNEFGELQVEREGKIETYGFRQIEYLPPGSR